MDYLEPISLRLLNFPAKDRFLLCPCSTEDRFYSIRILFGPNDGSLWRPILLFNLNSLNLNGNKNGKVPLAHEKCQNHKPYICILWQILKKTRMLIILVGLRFISQRSASSERHCASNETGVSSFVRWTWLRIEHSSLFRDINEKKTPLLEKHFVLARIELEVPQIIKLFYSTLKTSIFRSPHFIFIFCEFSKFHE
jgi:hypothetical protein